MCAACDGMGSVIRNPCTSCKGQGTVHSQAREAITIPKGVDNATKLRASKKGHAGV